MEENSIEKKHHCQPIGGVLETVRYKIKTKIDFNMPITTPYFLGFSNQNYLLKIQNSYQDIIKFVLVSPGNRIIHTYETEGRFIYGDMPTKDLILVLFRVPGKKIIRLSQWSLNDNKIVNLDCSVWLKTVHVFTDSSLIGLCYQKTKQQKTRITLNYYQYPLKDNKTGPVHEFSFKIWNYGQIFYEKINNYSSISIEGDSLYNSGTIRFHEYSIKFGLRLHQFKLPQLQNFKVKILQIVQVKPGLIYLNVRKDLCENLKSTYEQFLIKIQGRNSECFRILNLFNHGCQTQFSNCYKRKRKRFQQLPYSYVDPQTFEVFQIKQKNICPSQHLFIPAYDGNLQVYSKYDRQKGQILVREERLTQFRFGRKTMIVFLMEGIQPNFHDDLVYQVLQLLLEKGFI